MCQNCMVYNADDTIFYKEAVKIQNFINSLFGKINCPFHCLFFPSIYNVIIHFNWSTAFP